MIFRYVVLKWFYKCFSFSLLQVSAKEQYAVANYRITREDVSLYINLLYKYLCEMKNNLYRQFIILWEYSIV